MPAFLTVHFSDVTKNKCSGQIQTKFIMGNPQGAQYKRVAYEKTNLHRYFTDVGSSKIVCTTTRLHTFNFQLVCFFWFFFTKLDSV